LSLPKSDPSPAITLVATTSIADFGAATDKQHRETEVLQPWRLSGTILLDPRARRIQ
jgi:hypothetical protein